MIEVRPAEPGEIDRCQAIRHDVFVVGQGVPKELEVDGQDHLCSHVLAFWEGEAVGTGRLRPVANYGKVERVAVLAEHRGKGLGAAIMAGLHQAARGLGMAKVELGSQTHAIGFYERLGYEAYGPVFDELSCKFKGFVDVLADLKAEARGHPEHDVLRLYEIWLRTGSPRAERLLRDLGVEPNTTLDGNSRH